MNNRKILLILSLLLPVNVVLEPRSDAALEFAVVDLDPWDSGAK